jgi:hypothetical protein
MEYSKIARAIADILKEFDSEKPVHKAFQAGIGPVVADEGRKLIRR